MVTRDGAGRKETPERRVENPVSHASRVCHGQSVSLP